MRPKSVKDRQFIYQSQLSAELAIYVLACAAKSATAKGQEEECSTGYQIANVYATIMRIYCIYCLWDNRQMNISIAKIGDIATNLHPCY